MKLFKLKSAQILPEAMKRSLKGWTTMTALADGVGVATGAENGYQSLGFVCCFGFVMRIG